MVKMSQDRTWAGKRHVFAILSGLLFFYGALQLRGKCFCCSALGISAASEKFSRAPFSDHHRLATFFTDNVCGNRLGTLRRRHLNLGLFLSLASEVYRTLALWEIAATEKGAKATCLQIHIMAALGTMQNIFRPGFDNRLACACPGETGRRRAKGFRIHFAPGFPGGF
jgi:hypothetical protein